MRSAVKGDVERDLYPRADDLAVSLHGMAVPYVKQGALDGNGEVDLHSLAEPPVVHVAAVGIRGGARDRLPARWGHPEAADHRVELELDSRQWPFGRQQPRSALFRIYRPLGGTAVEAVAELRDIAVIENVGGDAQAGEPGRPVGLQLVQGDDQGIPGLRSGDVEGACLRIAGLGNRRATGVPAPGVDGRRRNSVARGDLENRLVAPYGGVVMVGDEQVMSHD